MSTPVQRDHSGQPAIKIVMHGPVSSGKTSALRVFTVVKKIEDPTRLVSELSSIRAPTGTTMFFDKATFLAGEFDMNGQARGARIHVWTTPGDATQHQQRDIVFEGTQGFILLLSAEPDQSALNLIAMEEIHAARRHNEIPIEVLINKVDLAEPDEKLIVSQLVSVGLFTCASEARRHIHPVSILQARNDLVGILGNDEFSQLLNEEGRIKRDRRPKSVDRVVQAFRAVAVQVVCNALGIDA